MSTYDLSKHTVFMEHGGKKVAIYISRPTISTKRPAIMIVHEWWGLNDHIRSIADRYAGRGYVAAAVDLYSGMVAKNREEAMNLAKSVSPEESSKILGAAVEYLTQEDFITSKVGIQGFCFGGTHVFNFVCESEKITAAVIFYASILPSKEKLNGITSPLLIVYGDKDHAVKPEQIQELETMLKKLKKKAQIEIYPGAGHAFANETGPNYNEAAAKEAWDDTEKFLETFLPLPKA